jgi:hypothetical protein
VDAERDADAEGGLAKRGAADDAFMDPRKPRGSHARDNVMLVDYPAALCGVRRGLRARPPMLRAAFCCARREQGPAKYVGAVCKASARARPRRARAATPAFC